MAEDDLVETFHKLPDGPLQQLDFIGKLQAEWYSFQGVEDTSLYKSKLSRAESVSKKGNCMYFDIERHGATVNGSTRGEVHTWEVNFEDFTARIIKKTHRQLKKMDKAYNPESDVETVIQLILAKKEDDCLQWRKDKKACRVLTKKIIHSNFVQTQTARAKRFKILLSSRLDVLGLLIDEKNWVRTKSSDEA